MLRSLKALREYVISAKDYDIGRVQDFYFHDDTWVVRYMVLDTGHWLPGRKVLISTNVLGKPDWAGHSFPVALTREQIQNSPEIDTDKPVSRQQEAELHDYFGWPYYWVDLGTGVCGAINFSAQEAASATARKPTIQNKGDPHLRSVREVAGYRLHASDGELGHINDFIADDNQWVIRYLVIELSNWLPAKKVLVSPHWLKEINYANGKVEADLTRLKLLNCPEYQPTAPVNRELEERLYDYHGRPVYCVEGDPDQKRDE